MHVVARTDQTTVHQILPLHRRVALRLYGSRHVTATYARVTESVGTYAISATLAPAGSFSEL
jgi:hypothetical protein